MNYQFVTIYMSIILYASLAGFAFAENDPKASGTAIAFGICRTLIASADDFSNDCDNQLASVTDDDGTIMFIFSANGVPFGFSGNGKMVAGMPNGSAMLPVSFIAVGVPGDPTTLQTALPASGTCIFGDPYNGVSDVHCSAMTKAGAFEAIFETDGKPPITNK